MISPSPLARMTFADLWLAPHRPLFLAAALWAVISVGWWQWYAWLGLPPPSLGLPNYWHAHEMLMGFGGASVAAYFLTALSSWTARSAPSGPVLKLLVLAWLLQRLAMALAESLPLAVLLLPGALYFGLVTGILAQGVIAARLWSKLGFPAAVAALGVGDALFVASAREAWTTPEAAMLVRCLVMFFAIKVSVIGGRMIPAFTGNWLKVTGAAVAAPRMNLRADQLSLAVLLLALVQMAAGAEWASAFALMGAGVLQIWRLTAWRGCHVMDNGLLVAMQGAFVWLALGLLLWGLARLPLAGLREADLLHALAMGAMGGMVLAVASRAAARRDQSALRAGPVLGAGCAALWFATTLRLAVAVWPDRQADLAAASALLWILGWLLFLTAYLPTLVGPVIRPIFSGPKA